MEVEKGVAARKDLIRHKIGNLLRDGTQRVPWKGPVEIQTIDRRGAGTSNDGMYIVGWHQDQTSLHRAGVKLAREIANGDWSLIFVAVIATFENHGWPIAVGDHDYRYARDTPGIIMGGVRKHDPAELLARLVQIDGGKCRSTRIG